MNSELETTPQDENSTKCQARLQRDILAIEELKAKVLHRVNQCQEAWESECEQTRPCNSNYIIFEAKKAVDKLDQKFQGQIRQFLSLVKSQESLDRRLAGPDSGHAEFKRRKATVVNQVESPSQIPIESEDEPAKSSSSQSQSSKADAEPSMAGLNDFLGIPQYGSGSAPMSVKIAALKRKLAEVPFPGIDGPATPKLSFEASLAEALRARLPGLQGSRGS